MLYEKYKPIFLKDYKIHLELIPKLQNLCKKDISNLLIYGPTGSGKMTIVKTLINTYYNENIIENDNSVKINSIEVKFKSSSYYFQISLTHYYNKKNFEALLSYLCENSEINSKCKFKLIIIKNIEYIDFESIKYLKSVIEKKYNRIRFILITSKISKINNFFKGFFLLLRIKYPTKIELNNYISKIYSKKIVVKTLNLNELFIKLETNTINNYIDPYELYTTKLIKLINTKKSTHILKIRELLYELMSKNYNLIIIFRQIMKYYTIKTTDYNKTIEIIELFNNYNNTKSFKNIIHLESILINIMAIIK